MKHVKTRKILALALSILMIISAITTTGFAAPSAVTVGDSVHEHEHIHADVTLNTEDDTVTTDKAVLAAEKVMTIILRDSYGDGWNSAYLSIYKGDDLYSELTIEDSDTSKEKTFTFDDYDDLCLYSFVWSGGFFDDECDFEIFVDGESVYATLQYELKEAENGDIVYRLLPNCTHEIGEGTCVCTICGLTCGKDFAHEFDEENTCTVCLAKCGSESFPHDWKNKDGICGVCKAECSHSFTDNTCTVCGFVKAAYVTAGDNTTYYITFEEAVEAAGNIENSILFLNKTIYTDALNIDAGTLSLNLNGYELNLYDCINVEGTAELTIDGSGTLYSQTSTHCLCLYDSSKVTIKNGTFENYVEQYGEDSHLTIEGGTFAGNMQVHGGTATFKGDDTNGFDVTVYGGSLVFEEFDGIEKIQIQNYTGQVLTSSEITLPEGYVLYDVFCLEVQQIEYEKIGYVAPETELESIPYGLYFVTLDSASDSWNGAKIEVYKVSGEEEELVGTIEMTEYSFSLDSFALDYDMTSEYKFKWIPGSYDIECGFAILVNKELVYKTYSSFDSFENAQTTFLTLEAKCTGHEFENGSNVCKNCSLECGKDFAHSFGDDHICDICLFECGTTDNPHSYEDGCCTVCKTECTHEFEDNVCSVCSVKRFYTVKTEERTHFFENFQEAVLFAVENNESTLTLYRDVDLGENGLDIEIGDFTLDLNGFKITSSNYTSVVRNETLLTICDSSKEKTGRIETTSSDCAAICLHDYTMLTLQSGTVYGPHRAIVMDLSGAATQAVVEINGGKVISDDESSVVIKAHGDSVIVNGGETRGIILHMTGTVDLSEHPNPAGIIIQNQTGDALPADVYNLPDGCYFVDPDGETTDTIKESINYTVAGAPPVAIDVGVRVNDTNFRYKVINGVRDSYAIPEEGTVLYLDVQEDTLVEIVEKASYDAVEAAKTQYFFVDAETRQVKALSLTDYSSMYDETQVRVKDPEGLRFIADISTSARNEKEEFVIDEYGFIVAAAQNLGEDDLTFDFSNYRTGVVYKPSEDIDLILDSSDDLRYVVAGSLVNIPVKHYKTDVVCRTYTKLTIDETQFVIYGEKKVGNFYDTASALLEENPDDANLQKIVEDYDNYISLPEA